LMQDQVNKIIVSLQRIEDVRKRNNSQLGEE